MRRFTIDELPAVLDMRTKLVPSLQVFESEDRLFRKVFDWGSTRLEVRLTVDAQSPNFGAFLAWMQAKGRTEKFQLPLGRIPGFFGCDPDSVPSGVFWRDETLFRKRHYTTSPAGTIDPGDRIIHGINKQTSGFTEQNIEGLVGCLFQAGTESAVFSSSGVPADLNDSEPTGKVYLVTGVQRAGNLLDPANTSLNIFCDPPVYEEPAISTGPAPYFISYYTLHFGVAVEPVFRLESDIEVRPDPDRPADQLATIRLVEDVDQVIPAQAWITPSGAPHVGQTLTANLFLPEGEATGIAYKWQRVNSAGTAVDHAGATNKTLVVPNYIGWRLQCVIAYTDPEGVAKSITTPTTEAIIARPASAISTPTGITITRSTLQDDLPDDERGTRESWAVAFNAVSSADSYTVEFENRNSGLTQFRSVESSPAVFEGRFEFESGLNDRVRARVRSITAAGVVSAWSAWVEYPAP